ncbi:DUF3800 domain-containing protein [Neobacillus ginsengisoli]|uniref:DUF3800 domain-containing protein n=1 Tax=Neobacillus ginsengisoli TaxID=904295 RepID=A0ABT9Y3R7_9BACI|nr:DUF3800 domain-containing protein [Neobacillus ginsengisoli]MDQ0202186.1 hypothetical protein [Neobacillus ginsengisoli]
MYVYIDDSGNIDSATGSLYVWAGFSIHKGQTALKSNLEKVIQNFTYDTKIGELKGKDASFEQKQRLFETLVDWHELRICYLVADKKIVTEAQSKFITGASSRSKEQSENYFLSKVVTRLSEPFPEQDKNRIILNIDGEPIRKHESHIRLHEYLSLRVNYPKWKKDTYVNHLVINYNSELNNSLIQTADFLANFFLEYYKYLYYQPKKSPTASAKYTEIYNILLPKIHHRIVGLPNFSLL